MLEPEIRPKPLSFCSHLVSGINILFTCEIWDVSGPVSQSVSHRWCPKLWLKSPRHIFLHHANQDSNSVCMMMFYMTFVIAFSGKGLGKGIWTTLKSDESSSLTMYCCLEFKWQCRESQLGSALFLLKIILFCYGSSTFNLLRGSYLDSYETPKIHSTSMPPTGLSLQKMEREKICFRANCERRTQMNYSKLSLFLIACHSKCYPSARNLRNENRMLNNLHKLCYSKKSREHRVRGCGRRARRTRIEWNCFERQAQKERTQWIWIKMGLEKMGAHLLR